jgi:hypothetical protein
MIRLTSQCNIAVAPESLAAVQAVRAKIDPAAGTAVSAAKDIISARSAKGEPLPPLPRFADPLDRIMIKTNSPLVTPVVR